MIYQELEESVIEKVMIHGEFEQSLLETSPAVAIILTQDWCPQWVFMHQFLKTLSHHEPSPALSVFYFRYDKSSLFEKFMHFKETRWENAHVPYVRYYQDGKFNASSNFVTRHDFLGRLGIRIN